MMKKLMWVGLAMLALIIGGAYAVRHVLLSEGKPYSYHEEKLGEDFSPPFSRPRLPATATDVHVEASATLMESMYKVRFTATAAAIEKFLRENNYTLHAGVAQSTAPFCALAQAPFDASSVKMGRSFNFNDEVKQECSSIVLDEAGRTLYLSYASW